MIANELLFHRIQKVNSWTVRGDRTLRSGGVNHRLPFQFHQIQFANVKLEWTKIGTTIYRNNRNTGLTTGITDDLPK